MVYILKYIKKSRTNLYRLFKICYSKNLRTDQCMLYSEYTYIDYLFPEY